MRNSYSSMRHEEDIREATKHHEENLNDVHKAHDWLVSWQQ